MEQRPHWMTAALAILTVVFLFAPLFAAIPVSFTPDRFLSMPSGTWSLRHYETVVTDPAWLSAIRTSFLVGFVSSVVAVVLSAAFCIGLWMTQPRIAALLIGVATAPMAIPPIISGLALFFFVSRTGMHDTFLGTVIAHVMMVAPFAVVTLLVALSQVERRTDLAARNLGASLWQTVGWVIVPQIKGGLAGAWVLTFLLSWEEVSVTLLVTGSRLVTLPRQIWTGLRDAVDPAVAAVSVIMIAATLLVVVVRLIVVVRRPG